MKPGVIIEVHKNRIVPETEILYNADIFLNHGGVANSLDNIDSITYIDCSYVYYRKPLLEYGTILISTLKNFPNAIEYALHWNIYKFKSILKQAAESVYLYIMDHLFINRPMKLAFTTNILEC